MIDGRDEGGNTDLMRAALNGQNQTVKALLLGGADVNARNHEGRTALMFAIVNLHTSRGCNTEVMRRAILGVL